MLIIWRGLGLVVLVIGFGSVLLFKAVTEALTRDENYYGAHVWPRLTAYWLAAALLFLFSHLRKEKPDSLFFIPVRVWSIIFFILALPIAIIGSSDNAMPVIARQAAPVSQQPTDSSPTGLQLKEIHFSSYGAAVSSATINNQMIFTGDKVGEYTVTVIEASAVTVQSADGKKKILRPINSGGW